MNWKLLVSAGIVIAVIAGVFAGPRTNLPLALAAELVGAGFLTFALSRAITEGRVGGMAHMTMIDRRRFSAYALFAISAVLLAEIGWRRMAGPGAPRAFSAIAPALQNLLLGVMQFTLANYLYQVLDRHNYSRSLVYIVCFSGALGVIQGISIAYDGLI